MKKIVIIGAGFAGISAIERLRRTKLDIEIILIDKKGTFDFLPLLPDCLGRGIGPGFLAYELSDLREELKFKLVRDEVTAVNPEDKKVFCRQYSCVYDYLLIASGSETNFYGNKIIAENAYKIDSVADVRALSGLLREKNFEHYIVCGGGYTGIEAATNLRLFLDKAGRDKPVIIVERSGKILGPLPQWMKDYVLSNLKRLRIAVYTNSAIEKIEDAKAYVGAGKSFDQALVVWAAGVKTADFIQGLKAEKNPQGRIKVDAYLRINESCFAAGDAAYFDLKGNFLRMAVQFAICEGDCAAVNIINSINGRGLRPYRPLDLGYVIPMANNRSCGRVFGVNFKGSLPTLFHFMMCIYRSYGLRNKTGVIRSLFGKAGVS